MGDCSPRSLPKIQILVACNRNIFGESETLRGGGGGVRSSNDGGSSGSSGGSGIVVIRYAV